MILLIDNYDSFVFNLARYFERLGQPTHVVRNDAITPHAIAAMNPAAIVLSPGPCTPNEAGCSLDVVKELAGKFPILGICLGHQTIGAAFGAQIIRASEPMHGRVSEVFHHHEREFASVASPFRACRYHSLVIDPATLPECLAVTAQTADGTIMAVSHRHLSIVGWQFHPESILTEPGYLLLANWLRQIGRPLPAQQPTLADERLREEPSHSTLPTVPVTF